MNGNRAKRLAAAPRRPFESGDVIEELRRRYDRLTQSQKRIAEYIVENSEAVAFSTVDQMAAQLDVNPSTIVRFTYRLGLSGFPDLQERMRQLVRGHLSRAAEVVSETPVPAQLQGTTFGASLEHDLKNVRRTLSGLVVEELGRAVDLLLAARRVYVAAGFSTYAVAHHFGLILDRLRGDTILLGADHGFGASRLSEISAEDCVLAITFPPYAAMTHRTVLWAKENKAKIVAVTDTPISEVGRAADIVLLVASAGTGMQNSLVAPMMVTNALLNGVAAAKGNAALERYGRLDRLMNKWDAFLLKGDNGE